MNAKNANDAHISSAIDRVNNILYTFGRGDVHKGQLYAYDINTKQATFKGFTEWDISGLVFNQNDGYLYGAQYLSGAICQINPNNASNFNCNYGFTFDEVRGLMLSKDNTELYYVRENRRIYRTPFNSPSLFRSTLVINLTPVLNEYGFKFINAMEWLNDIPNDNTLLLGIDGGFNNGKYWLITYNLDTNQVNIISQNENNYTLSWLTGIEPLYYDVNNCADLLPHNDPLPPLPTILPDICPCYSNINITIEYDPFKCCGLGITIKSINPDIMYGVDESKRGCFVKENGVTIIEHYNLNDKIYYQCEAELLPAVNKYDAYKTKFNEIVSYFYIQNNGKSELSLIVIIIGIAIIIFILSLFGSILYCFYTCFCQKRNNIEKYKPFNTDHYTTTDIEIKT